MPAALWCPAGFFVDLLLLIETRNVNILSEIASCSTNSFAYCKTFLHSMVHHLSVVCLSSVTFIHPAQFDGFACHLESSNTALDEGPLPLEKGRFGGEPPSINLNLSTYDLFGCSTNQRFHFTSNDFSHLFILICCHCSATLCDWQYWRGCVE